MKKKVVLCVLLSALGLAMRAQDSSATQLGIVGKGTVYEKSFPFASASQYFNNAGNPGFGLALNVNRMHFIIHVDGLSGTLRQDLPSDSTWKEGREYFSAGYLAGVGFNVSPIQRVVILPQALVGIKTFEIYHNEMFLDKTSTYFNWMIGADIDLIIVSLRKLYRADVIDLSFLLFSSINYFHNYYEKPLNISGSNLNINFGFGLRGRILKN